MAAKKGKSASKSTAKKAPAKAKPKAKPKTASKKDWFADLDAELDKKTEMALGIDEDASSKKEDMNRILIGDFWNIVLRFKKINIHFSIDPVYNAFAQFKEFPFDWSLKDNFDYADVNLIQIADKTQSHNRVGDTLKLRYYKQDDKQHIRLAFEFCEGEHYYKYSGWKRTYGEFIAYDTTVTAADIDKIHAIMADIVRVWYESHLRRDREIILTHLDKNYEKGEAYTV